MVSSALGSWADETAGAPTEPAAKITVIKPIVRFFMIATSDLQEMNADLQ
jgi:hypothetical protein